MRVQRTTSTGAARVRRITRRRIPIVAAAAVLLLSAGVAPREAFAAAHPVELLAWSPGLPRAEVESQLGAGKVRPIRRGQDALLVESPLLRNLFARQRALLEFDEEGKLASVTVHLLPDRDGAGRELLQLYEDARELLLQRLGTPSATRERGTLPAGQELRALGDGSIVRCMDWELAADAGSSAHIVRLGIPRSASSESRVEIRIVGAALPPPEAMWGRDF
jgi:hypothetical protein